MATPRKPKAQRTLNEYLAVQKDMTGVLNTVLTTTADRLESALLESSGVSVSEVIGRNQMIAARAQIHRAIEELYVNEGLIIKRFDGRAAEAAVKAFSVYEGPFLERILQNVSVDDYVKFEMLAASNRINAVMSRIMGKSYVPLSSRIYGTSVLSKGIVDRYIEVALAQGLSARDFAKGVKDLILPNVPGGVSYASMRLARTEINNAFHATSIDRYQESVYVESVDWNLSSSHPSDDDCNLIMENGPYPKDQVPLKPHPNCFCYITPRMISEEAFLALASGPMRAITM